MKLIGTGILLMGLIHIQCLSQTAVPDTIPPASATQTNNNFQAGIPKMHVNVLAGTQFWSASGYGSGMRTSFMTGISYPIGKKFLIGGGIGVNNNTLFGIRNPANESFGNFSYTNSLVYVTGQYLLNRHITVSGTVFKEFNVMNNNREYQRFLNNTPQGAYMKIHYRINDFMQIEAGFGYTKGVNPYYNSFMTPAPYNGIFSDPFIR